MVAPNTTTKEDTVFSVIRTFDALVANGTFDKPTFDFVVEIHEDKAVAVCAEHFGQCDLEHTGVLPSSVWAIDSVCVGEIPSGKLLYVVLFFRK